MEATCLASIQRTASGRVLNSTKANPREAPRKAGDSAQKQPTSVLLLYLCILNPFAQEDPRSVWMHFKCQTTIFLVFPVSPCCPDLGF